MRTISSAQQQKVALTVVLSLLSETEVQAGLQLRSASSCQTIQKLLQPNDPLRKKLLLAQKSHNAKNYNANSHAHNLKK
jgi:hypothetical protein